MSKTRRTFNFSQIPDQFVRFDVSSQGLNSTQQGNARANIAAEAAVVAGTVSQYYRGDKSWQTLNTTVVSESGNLYFTEARVRATLLTGYAVGANSALAATDSILAAMGKIQGQLNGKQASGSYAASSHTHSISDITSLQSALDSKAASTHTHSATDINAGTMATARLGSGTANNSVFLRGDSTWAAVTWGNLSGVPSSFTPSAHTHPASDITSGTMATARLGSGTANNTVFLRGDSTWAQVAYSNLSGVPSTFAPSAHTHPWTDITSRPTTLSGYGITDAVPSSRTITINGTAFDLSANRSWTISTGTGTVTSVATGTGLTGGTITTTGTLSFDTTWGDARYLRSLSILSNANVWSHTTLTAAIQLGGHTTGSTGFPATLGQYVVFQTSNSDSASNYGRMFALHRSYNTETYSISSPNTSGTANPWRTLWHSGNFDPSGYALTTANITAASFTTTTLTLTRAAGNITATIPTWNQNTTGSAATLTTPRSFTIGATAKTFNGSANVSWSLGEIGAQPAGMYWQVVDTNADLNTATGYETYYRTAFQSANRPPSTNWANVFSIRYNDATLFSQLAFIPGNRIAIRYGESGSWWSWSEIWSQSNLPVPVSGAAGSGYTIPRNNWVGSQAQYDAIGSKSNDTIYFIV